MNKETLTIGRIYPVGTKLRETGTNRTWFITGASIDIMGNNTFYFDLHCPERGIQDINAFREDASLEFVKKYFVRVGG